MNQLLLLICVAVAGLDKVSVRAQNVVCSSTVGCDDNIGVMSPEECCLGTPNGLAYDIPGQEVCVVCIVYGFFQDSFIGVEQGPGHVVQAGYQKGAAQALRNLVLDVLVVRNDSSTAREGSSFDYTINTNRVRAIFGRPDPPDNVVFTFRVDAIAQETNETLTLQLALAEGSIPPSGDAVFFRDTLSMVIVDSDTVEIFFTEDDFRANEPDLMIPVVVTKNSRIANPITLDVIPLTVTEAMASMPPPLPPNIPQENPFSPPFADLADFDNTVVRITFAPDEDLAVNDVAAPIPIDDDPVNEAIEQAFVVQLQLNSSVNPGSVDLTTRQASLCRIIDDDPIRIGFELPSYTYLEPMFEELIDDFFVPESDLPVNGPVFLAKENNVTSEQTFLVVVQASGSVPPGQGIQQASLGDDYSLGGQLTSSVLQFPSTDQRLNFPFTLFADNFPEGTEAFLASSAPDPGEGVPTYLNPTTLSPESFIVIEDDDPIIIGFEETMYAVNESDGIVEVYVRVFSPPDAEALPATVDLVIQTVSGSATGGDDYEEINADALDVPLQFDDATRRQSFIVTIIDDSTVETEKEDFNLELRFDPFQQPPSGTLLLPNVSTITIEDDDELSVSFERDTYTVGESDGSVEVCFLTSGGHDDPIEVVIQPVMKGVDNPAASDSDFDSSSQTRTFQPSNTTDGTLCVNIPIIDDVIDESDEQFLVTFGNLPTDQVGVGEINQTCVTIQDDDVPEFMIGPNITVNESTPDVEICVTTESILGREVVVTVITGPKSGATDPATADEDYETTTFMLTFMPTDESPQIMCSNVSIIDDMVGNEPNEEFSVTISDATPMGTVSDEACITIVDDDTPEVEWEITEITIPEGEDREICFTTNIGTATPYEVAVGVRQKGASPATSDDYDILSAQIIIIPEMPSGGRYCIDVSIVDDTIAEDEEQFELYFENLPSEFATVGDNDTVCITIDDNDEPPPPVDEMVCRITEPLRVKPFERTTMYGFMGTCEHIAVSPCELISGFDVRVTVDFLTESMENGAVGLHVNELRYVSREDGSFDDGGQTPIESSPAHRRYLATPPTGVSVYFDQVSGETNITFSVNTDPNDPLNTDIRIIHTYGGSNASIQINLRTPNNSAIADFCGLCGTRSGALLKRDGTVANIMNMAEVQDFAQSYLVEPRDQILRPQRKECGTIRNDTVIGDPLYAAPVYSEDGKEYSLCYEVFGRTNAILNLVSDTCVSVNAHYGPMDNPEEGNIIDSIGVRANGMSGNSCHNIQVDLDGCSATVTRPDGSSVSLSDMQRFKEDGISVKKYPRRVRISVPNCENVMLVMWVICESRSDNQTMIKFVIARGVNLRASSHGLLGQFWNIPVTFEKYTGSDLPSYIEAPESVYVVTVQPEPPSLPRSFLGEFYNQKWDLTEEACLYVGNAQGGPSFDVEDPNDSVIEGYYRDYIITSGDLFDTDYTFVQFEEERC